VAQSRSFREWYGMPQRSRHRARHGDHHANRSRIPYSAASTTARFAGLGGLFVIGLLPLRGTVEGEIMHGCNTLYSGQSWPNRKFVVVTLACVSGVEGGVDHAGATR